MQAFIGRRSQKRGVLSPSGFRCTIDSTNAKNSSSAASYGINIVLGRVAPRFDFMLKSGILNPGLLSLLARVRHTNALVIADRGFPSWPGLETVDLSLVDGVPTVLQVLEAIRPNFVLKETYMAAEFLKANPVATR